MNCNPPIFFLIGFGASNAISAIVVQRTFYPVSLQGTSIRILADNIISFNITISFICILIAFALMIYEDRHLYTGK